MSVVQFPDRKPIEPRLSCPTCGEPPAQRLDTFVHGETVAACVCTQGHLFITQWETNQ